jgi:hypothetical protein
MSVEIKDASALEQHHSLLGSNHLLVPPNDPINVMFATTDWVMNKIQTAQFGGTSTVDGGSF